ncbi:small-conductance mechanosensitive channel [Nitrobacteraceae bacterium AZCC 1564]
MQKVDLDSMSIEDLAQLRDQATEKLAEKVAARQRELVAEMERLSAYGKMVKTPAPKKEAKDLKDVKDALTPQPQAVKAA